MDIQQLRKLKPRLRQFLKRFDDCFPRKDTRAHLPVYVRGQLSDSEAVTDISQVYQNDTGKKIEVLYQFPLPEKGAVTDLVVRINQRTIFGRVPAGEGRS